MTFGHTGTATDTEQILRRLEAERQIHEVLLRVARGVDRLDRDLIVSGYHPDAIDYHGAFEGSAAAFADWVIGRHAGKIQSCMHRLSNIYIEWDGDTARVESYVISYYRYTEGGVTYDMMAPGRYLDIFDLRDGAWKIAERLVVFEKSRIDEVVLESSGPLTELLVQSSRDTHDVSYAFFAGDRT